MTEEFTISTGMKILYGFLAALFTVPVLLFGEISYSRHSGIAVIPILIIAPLILLLIGNIRKTVIISADSIVSINIFRTRELPTVNIKGCRVGSRMIVIESNSPFYPKMKIGNYDDFINSGDLVKWLKENFQDLDSTDLEKDHNRILANMEFGATSEDREKTIGKAKPVACTYNIAGLILGFSMIFCNNNLLVALSLFSFPLLGILVMIFSKGLIKFLSNSKRSVHQFIMLGFFIPAFILLLKALSNYEILDHGRILLPFTAFGAGIILLLYHFGINRAVGTVAGQIGIMLIAAAIYCYGSIIQINCVFDKSVPRLVHTYVNSKWVEHNKGVYYHLKLYSWTTDKTPKDIEVSKVTYYRYSAGQEINVNIKKGELDISWYYLP